MRALFLADGGPTVGLGHLKRSLVLAETLSHDGFNCRFFVPEDSARKLAEAKGFAAEIWPDDLTNLPASDLLVADSYRADLSALRGWRTRGAKLLVIDDLGDRDLLADFILNQNFFAETLDYGPAASKLLLGPRFALVDSRFIEARDKRRRGKRPRLLIAFGGSDNGKLATAMGRALDQVLTDVELNLVVSPLHEITPEVRSFTAGNPRQFHLHHGADMPSLMAQSDVYLGSAGTQTLEAAAAGLPMVVAQISDNQAPNIAAVAAKGVPAFTAPEFKAMARAAMRIIEESVPNPLAPEIDGQGAKRTAKEIRSALGV